MAVNIIRGMEDLVASGSQLVWSLAHQTLRRWYNRGLMPCRRLLEVWFRIGKCYQMTEGRLCQVHLLDGRKLELLVQPKLLSRELLDLVASHFNLKEKEYFGLCFIDDTGQNNWLQLDRKVLDHDFSKTSGPLELKFLVRFYIERITFLKENTTVELFFLNAKSLVFNETIEVESGNVFKLAAFALQEAKGDYTSVETARSDLKQLPVLPTRALREHPSLHFCEDKVIEHYKKLKGLTRGQAIVQYLALVESLPTYGVHYYPVKDKQEIPWWLGVSYKGIGQYDLQDKLKPRKNDSGNVSSSRTTCRLVIVEIQLFQWKQLENLYFREKKFAVEVNDPHRRTVTKRTFGQTGLVIHTWYASHSLIKTIWVMAISQHQFYLDRKQSKSKMTTTRSTGDIAMDLTEICAPRITKLSSIESKDQLIMASNGSLISASSLDSEVTEEQKKEKAAELKKKEKDLQDTLTQKLEELKKLCMREAEITGHLPKDYPLATGEKAPPVRRRMGTAFKLDDLFPYDEDPHLRNLESRFALQQKIVEAAIKLSNEGDLCKTVKKKRRNNCLDAMRKLEDIEKEINAYRIKKGKKPTQRASLILADDVNPSDLSSLSDSLTLDDDDELISQRQRSRSVQYSPRPHHAETLDIHYSKDRRASSNDQQADSRLNYGHVQESLHCSHRDALSSHSSPFKPSSRQPRDARSMPPTPLLTRNAYSSTQLRSEDAPQHFRQRSGSLESQSQFVTENELSVPAFTLSPARRSNSTEVLDDGSSYTSQSSVEYSVPGNHTHRRRMRGRHRKDMYANTGSMPNLAQPDTRCYAYQPRARPTTTAYYVTGYPSYVEPEPYSNGVYMYDNEMEGHYNVNPTTSYHPTPAAYHSHDMHSHYGNDEIDGMSQNPYATLRPPRNRPVPRSNEHIGKNIQKALVAEHLRGWYQRNAAHKQAAYNYDYDRGSQQSLGYQTMPAPYGHNNRNTSYSAVSTASSSSNWHSHMSSSGMSEYDMPMHAPQTYSYTTAPYSHPAHNRYGASQLLKGSWHSPDGQRRCAFFPASSSSSASSSTSSLPSSSFPSSSYSPGCRVRQVASSPAQPQSSRGHRLSKVSFVKGSS
ncbi:FERM domain-containing protein 4B isoform X3 [Acanthopagrus latus]|uniref:FERM domain-containing protein 4B isoform X2 n=1 Tax=Acanthopagrus latus TaxID=8177 RepID=UPI00187C0A5B|nr:FERM domain-containing protein 4B isoform X2 [Acanthopagrus latus]XP_036955762.1 FERM domain-containing protein 4B isoform X3 [Acanthopagrus latus]